jgi:hypothetical protein
VTITHATSLLTIIFRYSSHLLLGNHLCDYYTRHQLIDNHL